ncbi:reprolysin-like metallopeptidase [Flavobacterium enshiense]|uniref:zinc-dependent metalloprotease n=1 Tax=Flavobacterium enshiense TaxID=1341165 RepID=UPI00345D2300
MKKTLLVAITAFAISTGYAQTDKFWKASDGKKVEVNKTAQRDNFPQEFKLFDLEVNSIKQTLLQSVTSKNTVVITLPNTNGGFERFQMVESSNFEPALQAQFPGIRSFIGVGLDDNGAQVNLSLDPRGIQTMVTRNDRRNEFMEPYSTDGKTYAVYNSSRERGKLPFTCTTQDHEIANGLDERAAHLSRSNSGQLLTFRLALSCTAEYANYFGATSSAQVANVMAAYNATLTRVNGVYQKDLAIRLSLIANTTNVIYYNAGSDPYSDAANMNNWNAELQTNLTSVIGDANYDVGHLFGATGGGGNAGCIGCVCNSGKGSAYTSPANGVPAGDAFDIDYVAHEFGHQFGANHTFTHSTENNTANYEPGSGSTIMGYAGITFRNVQMNSDDYFHARSIEQIQSNMASKSCPTVTSITHGAPVIAALPNYTVPKSTPFMLTGSATDAGGGTLTYCWEQYDEAFTNGALCGDTNTEGDSDCVPIDTKTTGPVFRSYSPTTSPTRYFPRMASVMNGLTTTSGSDILTEALPSITRTLNFRLTVRDNVAAGGQTNYANTAVNVDGTKGPLTVTSQNTAGIVWAQGSTQTITWAVNNTNTITGGANVDILLSTDNGATFATTLATNIPNNGSTTITVPNVTAANCRVMVKANGNIFFNVNTKNIAIGNYTYQSVNACNDYTFNLNSPITESTTSYSGFSLPIADSFTVTDVNVELSATHPNINTTQFAISSPTGYAVTPTPVLSRLIRANNTCPAGGVNLHKYFDMSGTAFNCTNTTNNVATLPTDDISTANYNGTNSAGNWYIWFVDINNTDGLTGTINTLRLNLCYTQLTPVLANETFGLENFNLYPNPNKGNFNVQFTSNSSNEIKIGVHDLRGRLVFENNFQNTGTFNQNVTLNNVQSGIYIVTVQDGERKEVKKIVVE